MVELARIEEVDLRKQWPNEADDFTPWLQDNMDLLGDALGIELEVQQREASVGTFSLDLLARDVGNNRPVIIENQLESTDHSHLGQLLTYAAGYDASAIVWIAKEFREEHRAALDFLNRRTGEDTEFFGVAVELWKIENSRPAPHFTVVSTPNDWSKETKSQAVEVSERSRRYQAFFQPLMDSLREDTRFTRARQVRKALAQSWCSFSTGHGGGLIYSASFYRGGRARVEVYFDGGDKRWNKQLFDKIEGRKEKIESAIEGEFEWERLDEKKACRISVVRSGSIDDNDETLDEIREWMFDRLLDFERVFGPRLAELVANNEV